MDVPAAISRRMPSWLAAGIPSLVSVGFAYDANHVKAGSSPRRGYNLNASGIELAVAGILFGRVGRTNNSLGTGTTNRTWGIGAALPIGRWGALHYDYANVDREFGGRLTPESWSVEVNPIAIATDMR